MQTIFKLLILTMICSCIAQEQNRQSDVYYEANRTDEYLIKSTMIPILTTDDRLEIELIDLFQTNEFTEYNHTLVLSSFSNVTEKFYFVLCRNNSFTLNCISGFTIIEVDVDKKVITKRKEFKETLEATRIYADETISLMTASKMESQNPKAIAAKQRVLLFDLEKFFIVHDFEPDCEQPFLHWNKKLLFCLNELEMKVRNFSNTPIQIEADNSVWSPSIYQYERDSVVEVDSLPYYLDKNFAPFPLAQSNFNGHCHFKNMNIILNMSAWPEFEISMWKTKPFEKQFSGTFLGEYFRPLCDLKNDRVFTSSISSTEFVIQELKCRNGAAANNCFQGTP